MKKVKKKTVIYIRKKGVCSDLRKEEAKRVFNLPNIFQGKKR